MKTMVDLILRMALENPGILFNGDSASAECSATTVGPRPDECRLVFLDNSSVRAILESARSG
jgi:hypothetical protein